MPWLTGFGDVIAEAGRRAGVLGPDAVNLAGDPAALLAAWPGGATIDDPMAGRVEGSAAIRAFLAVDAGWMRERGGVAQVVATTLADHRCVGEYDVELMQAGVSFILPVAVAVEPDTARGAVAIRVYHSQWPLLGRHVLRPPLLARDPAVRESDVVGEYQAALAAGDAVRITATFEREGCFREPAGPQYRVCGTDALRPFFAGFFAVGGGIILEHCTVTEDGVRTALEFNAVRWGEHVMPHQAGIAIYERGASGKLADARVYDDVTPPFD
jgi:hypothetical protein